MYYIVKFFIEYIERKKLHTLIDLILGLASIFITNSANMTVAIMATVALFSDIILIFIIFVGTVTVSMISVVMEDLRICILCSL